MSKKIRVGIIGYGWVATAHIAAINATTNAEVTAVFSSRPLDQNSSAKNGAAQSPRSTISTRCSRIKISTPSQSARTRISTPLRQSRPAKAGKHLIIEKPLALNWKDCLAIEKAVKAAGVKVCVCFECRFSSQFLATKAVIDNGLLGDLHYGEVDYYHGIGPWYGQFRWNTRKDAGGSALLTAGCHALDALLLCMGGDVASVTSSSTKSKSTIFKPYEYDTSSVTIVNFKNGAIGKCAAVVDCLQPYYFHTHLCGSEGSLLDDKFHSMKLKTNKNAWSALSMKMLDSGDVSIIRTRRNSKPSSMRWKEHRNAADESD